MPLLSPNMNLPVPVVGGDTGPQWAQLINSCMAVIDSHSHAPGNGVKISAGGIDIQGDLPLSGNNLITARSVRFDSQSASLVLATDLGCLYVLNADLWFIDGAGNQVRITQSGSVSGSAGTITGLPSGTASAAFAASTFTFQSATLTPALMSTGPLTIGRNTASSKTVTITPDVLQSSNYDLSLPSANPTVAGSILTSDTSGNLSWQASGLLPIGSIIATAANLTGAYVCAATTVADNNGFVKCNGQTIADATSPMNGAVIPNINNSVFLMGSTTAGSVGGANAKDLSHTHTTSVSVTGAITMPAHTHTLGDMGGAKVGPSYRYSPYVLFRSDGPTYYFDSGAGGYIGDQVYQSSPFGGTISGTVPSVSLVGTTSTITSPSPVVGFISSGSCISNSQLSATQDFRPSYISSVYIMRIK